MYVKMVLKRDDDEEAYENDGAAVEASRKLSLTPHNSFVLHRLKLLLLLNVTLE